MIEKYVSELNNLPDTSWLFLLNYSSHVTIQIINNHNEQFHHCFSFFQIQITKFICLHSLHDIICRFILYVLGIHTRKYSWLTPASTIRVLSKTKCGAKDWTRVGCVQGKSFNPCTVSPAPHIFCMIA